MPLSPRAEDWPTMEMPRKLTVSIFSVTVITSRAIDVSVIEEREEARDGCRRFRGNGRLRRRYKL